MAMELIWITFIPSNGTLKLQECILTSVSSHEEAIFRLNTRHYSHGISMYPPRQSTNLLVLSSANTFLGSDENAVKTEISKKQLVL